MRAWRGAGGYSLVELLVSMAVLGLVMAGALGFLRAGVRAYGWGAARVEAQQSARVALERMEKELRQAGYDPRGAGIAPVAIAEPARVTFQRDLDGNGVVNATRERVTFLLRPGESILRREAGGGAQPLIEGVRRFALTYLDASGSVTTDPARVAAVRIRLEVGLRGPSAVMDAEVSLRNRPR
jgi:prepilin-type N-terminal cleavage/methylation domain-containing protein